MPVRSLPDHPDLAQVKRQARELRRDHAQRSHSAAARIRGQHPRLADRAPEQILGGTFALADAQLVIARE